METKHHRLAVVLARQNNVVTRPQLRACGFSNSAIDRMIRTGKLFVIRFGVYSTVPRLDRIGELSAVNSALGSGSAITAESAGSHLGIWRRRVHTIHATATGGDRQLLGVSFLRTRHLPDDHLMYHHNVRITTPARLICDMSIRQTPHALTNAMHEAEFRELFDAAATSEAADALQNRTGRKRVIRVRRALELHAAGSAGTMNASEDRFLELVDYAGLPEPWVNRIVRGIDHRHRLDTFWPDILLNCEVDGAPHSRPRSARSDEEQDGDVHEAGIHVERFSADSIWRDPNWVVRRLRELWSNRVAQRRRSYSVTS